MHALNLLCWMLDTGLAEDVASHSRREGLAGLCNSAGYAEQYA